MLGRNLYIPQNISSFFLGSFIPLFSHNGWRMTILILLYILYIYNFAEGEEPGWTILDISKPMLSVFQYVDCHVDSVPTRLFMSKKGETIIRVRDDRERVWSGANCSLVIIHYSGNKARFIRLIVEEKDCIYDVLCKRVGKEWKKIPSNTKMNSLTEITANTTTGVILDINFPPSNVKEVKTRWYGLDVQLFIPEYQCYAKEVCFVNVPIWKSGENCEKCTFIIVHLEHEIPITVHLLVRDKNGAVTSLYYVRDGGFQTSTSRQYCDRITLASMESNRCSKLTNYI